MTAGTRVTAGTPGDSRDPVTAGTTVTAWTPVTAGTPVTAWTLGDSMDPGWQQGPRPPPAQPVPSCLAALPPHSRAGWSGESRGCQGSARIRRWGCVRGLARGPSSSLGTGWAEDGDSGVLAQVVKVLRTYFYIDIKSVYQSCKILCSRIKMTARKELRLQEGKTVFARFWWSSESAEGAASAGWVSRRAALWQEAQLIVYSKKEALACWAKSISVCTVLCAALRQEAG